VTLLILGETQSNRIWFKEIEEFGPLVYPTGLEPAFPMVLPMVTKVNLPRNWNDITG